MGSDATTEEKSHGTRSVPAPLRIARRLLLLGLLLLVWLLGSYAVAKRFTGRRHPRTKHLHPRPRWVRSNRCVC